MKEFKFRAWDTKKKNWAVTQVWLDTCNPNPREQGIDKDLILRVRDSSVIIEQFTGIYDCSKQKHLTKTKRRLLELEGNMPIEWIGVPIYEGDIVEFNHRFFDDGVEDEDEKIFTLSGVVVYIDELMSFMLEGIKNKEWIRYVENETKNGNETLTDLVSFLDLEWAAEYFCVIGNIHENKGLLEETN